MIAGTAPPEDHSHHRSAAGTERKIAAFGGVAGAGALFSAASCCVLPLLLAAAGVGSAGLAAAADWHWPLTVLAILALTAAWLLRWRRIRACSADTGCAAPTARRSGRLMFLATCLVAASAMWPLAEAPLLRALGG